MIRSMGDHQPPEHIDLAAMLAAQIDMFLKHFLAPITREQLNQVVRMMLEEEKLLSENVMKLFTQRVSEGESNKIILQISSGKREDEKFTIAVKRRLEDCESLEEILGTALIISFTTSPSVRSILRVLGYNYMWMSPKPTPKPSLILVP